jgi:predicted transglutaminase-like cysteine proteinase
LKNRRYNLTMKTKVLSFVFGVAVLAVTLFSTAEFILSDMVLGKIEKEYGSFAPKRALALLKMMNRAKDANELDKLEKVNDFFNNTPYHSDQSVWGVSDYWATRLEFIGKDKGDCEDFVIAKYFTLKELGVPTSKLYMTYAKSLKFNVAHMVLTYYETPKSIPLVLDNYNYKILPANQRSDLVPVYSFSGDDLFNAKQAQLGKMLPAVTKQKRAWDELKIEKKEK